MPRRRVDRSKSRVGAWPMAPTIAATTVIPGGPGPVGGVSWVINIVGGMEPAAATPVSPVSANGHETTAERTHALVVARRRATALLGAVTVLFIVVTAVGHHGTLLGYVQAGAKASMVGGVADWFAVTALFRRPLRLPIPHTALIVERKDQFAATLGQFVQENFLSADVLAERIRAAGLVPRLAVWLSGRDSAARFAGRAADVVVTVTEALRDEDVQRVLTAELTRVVGSGEVAPLAGRGRRVVIAGGHGPELFNELLAAADGYLEGHHAELREMFESEAPRWVPGMAYRRVFERLYTRLRARRAAMAADPQDSTRLQFETWLAGLPDRLETDPQLRRRGEQLTRGVLRSTAVRDWSSTLWQRTKETLKAQAADPDSELRRRLTDLLMAAGRRLEADQRVADGLERMLETGAPGGGQPAHRARGGA